MEVRTGIYQPLIARAGSFIPTPKELRRKSILNVKSHVGHCLKYAVLAGLYADLSSWLRVF
jgi:hypothetical protein